MIRGSTVYSNNNNCEKMNIWDLEVSFVERLLQLCPHLRGSSMIRGSTVHTTNQYAVFTISAAASRCFLNFSELIPSLALTILTGHSIKQTCIYRSRQYNTLQ